MLKLAIAAGAAYLWARKIDREIQRAFAGWRW